MVSWVILMVYSIETIGMRIWKIVVFADFVSGKQLFWPKVHCHEAKAIVKPKSEVQSPKVPKSRPKGPGLTLIISQTETN